MTSWLWQQYTAATAGQSATDPLTAAAAGDALQPNAMDGMTNGSVIVYHLNADGTPSAAYATNSVPGSDGLLEPGEVRLPVSTGQTNGVAVRGDQAYTAADGEYRLNAMSPWLHRAATGSATVDSEKQLLRGALVDKVREIQRLTRELEQAYALIHQLKQHNEFLHRQWGQLHVAADTAQ